jgi:aminopeptidase N
MKLLKGILILQILLVACNNRTDKITPKAQGLMSIDNHSYANISAIHTTHLHLDLTVDFQNEQLKGVVRHEMKNNGSKEAIFDISGLKINNVTIGNETNELNTEFELRGKTNPILGQALWVQIKPETKFVNIYYETTEKSEALDWLDSALTSSKNKPFLYTQGQAILTRTWIPIQDVPSNRITYSADLKVPNDLMAVMSASNPQEKNNSGEYHFEMKQPIPCYLIALAVGDLVYGKLGKNTGVYCEPELLKESMYEFVDLPEMMNAAEKLYGSYAWDQYDLLILPYSFPFGGMENPRLTFANPTLLAGDRSLVSVIAHELAHSWSGNLVTNETWNDFWLNEGFTVYFENRIMEEIIGKKGADNLALVEFFELEEEIERIDKSTHPEDGHLFLNLKDRNPDDGMTDIAYVKGAFFLKTLEAAVGRDKMDVFLENYFNHFKFTSVSTDDFVSYLNQELLKKYDIDFNYEEWIYGKGIPENCHRIESSSFKHMEDMANRFQKGEDIFTIAIEKPTKNDPSTAFKGVLSRDMYSVQEWLTFIRLLPSKLSNQQMSLLDEKLKFTSWTNAEIQFEWFMKAIASDYALAYPAVESFLSKVGRRKFILPLYIQLYSFEHTKGNALAWFEQFKENYHAVSSNSIAAALELSK